MLTLIGIAVTNVRGRTSAALGMMLLVSRTVRCDRHLTASGGAAVRVVRSTSGTGTARAATFAHRELVHR